LSLRISLYPPDCGTYAACIPGILHNNEKWRREIRRARNFFIRSEVTDV
jgi:hypothetical protein